MGRAQRLADAAPQQEMWHAIDSNEIALTGIDSVSDILSKGESGLCEKLKSVDPSQWSAGRVRRAAKARAERPDYVSTLNIVAPQEKADATEALPKNELNVGVPEEKARSQIPDYCAGLSIVVPEEKVDAVVQPKREKANPACAQRPAKRSITLCDNIKEHYLLITEISPSTCSGVFNARRLSDGMEVVVKKREKMYRESEKCKRSSSKKQEESAWCRSADMLLNLPKSDNIAFIHEVLEDAEAYYVVMEKVQGLDLFEVLHSETTLKLEEAKAILYRLLQAVQELHEKGCIHKDLKLENVMLQSPLLNRKPWNKDSPDDLYSSMVVKLIDFDTVEAFSPKMISKRVVGTDQYIAQEAYAGHYSPASDIFSVGVIAFKLISGKFPFLGFEFDDWPGDNRVGSAKMKEIQDRLKTFNINFDMDPWPELPIAKDLVRWMLHKNEACRPTAEQALAHPFFETSRQSSPTPSDDE